MGLLTLIIYAVTEERWIYTSTNMSSGKTVANDRHLLAKAEYPISIEI